jgi:hypothetical protein
MYFELTPLFRKPDDGRVRPKHLAWLNSSTNLQPLFILLCKDGFNLLAPELFFLILAHLVYKM